MESLVLLIVGALFGGLASYFYFGHVNTQINIAMRKEGILRALKTLDGNIPKAASALGISPFEIVFTLKEMGKIG